MENKHQGKFHLLTIFLIPTLIISFAFIKNYYLLAALVVVAIILVYYVFKKL